MVQIKRTRRLICSTAFLLAAIASNDAAANQPANLAAKAPVCSPAGCFILSDKPQGIMVSQTILPDLVIFYWKGNLLSTKSAFVDFNVQDCEPRFGSDGKFEYECDGKPAPPGFPESTGGLFPPKEPSQEARPQTPLEHHVWQDKRSFQPYSRTAEAITGSIKLSGNIPFATPGSIMRITFGNGKSAELTSIGAFWREWNDADNRKVSAEVFALSHDPGKLRQGNTLCGGSVKDSARYIVFYEDTNLGQSLLGADVFESKKPPTDIGSPGLCGTFNFEIN